MGDEFQTKSQGFLAWFKSLPVATKGIPTETTLFTIPRRSIINVETSELPKKIPQVFTGNDGDDEDMENEPLDSWGSLILVMIYEFLQGAASPWKPYFEVLPEKFDTPMFWESSDLEHLKGSAVLSKIGKDEADEMFRSRILSVIAANPAVFYPEGSSPLGEVELLQLAHRMGSIIMAYAFDLDNEEEPEQEEGDEWIEDRDGKTMLGMVPMADILNADAEFNAHVNHGDDELTVTALRPIPAGEEILNYYGPHPNSELLRRYGYVTPKHSRYDVVEIPWDLVQTSVSEHLKIGDDVWKQVKYLDPEELEDVFVLERESGEPDSEGQFRTVAEVREISAELEEQLKAVLKAIKKINGDLIPDKRKRDEVFHAVIVSTLQKILSQYPTSTQEDEALLATSDLTTRQRMAIHVRLGEKKLLKEALEFAGSTAPAEGEQEEPERSSKRARTA
ncbi:Ribosomal lysine N-methyltransferase 4 [Colletotrichum aenigma]|uniref:Ribosomal lysine N-methyltransferase 4 n=1 Tax=Colletotrichum aenigma TaxID=1215731 RepID=UPI0018723C0C|nr:Ribosomal lysine N-methyltransferase 4 [Colletotrichum aenigma]KAF5524110.1 Ribosomal lysine N-methyltransferase 4 [Colletotrichum aenigma]